MIDTPRPTTRAEARQYAIDYQMWIGDQNLSYGELSCWETFMHTIAIDFDLLDEFRENGII